MKPIIAIDLGGTSAKLAIISPQGEFIDRWTLPTNNKQGGSQIVPELIHSIQVKLEQRQESVTDFLGIGMGSPGSIKPDGKVWGAYNLNWETPHSVKDQFEQAFDLPFCIANDANLAAMGEYWMGAGQGCDDLAMITLGTGVGGGIIHDGQLITGGSGSAGELGHLTLDLSDRFVCTCGKTGCLEAIASANGINNLAKLYLPKFPTSVQAQSFNLGGNMTGEAMIQGVQAGDPFSRIIFQEFCRYLGLACSHLANLFNPDRIIIGGGISNAGALLLDAVQFEYHRFVFTPIRHHSQLHLAHLANDAGILGAAYLLLSNERK